MPLGVRDVLLLIRARDQASRVLDQVAGSVGALGASGSLTAGQLKDAGSAMVGVGLGMAAVGGAGLVFFGSATKAAIEYSNASALTLTQVDQMGVKLDDIKRIGRDVAANIPAPFDQMQKSLYDIFSSMDVNVSGAQSLLQKFSEGAVAGQVDVQAAARASISIMNAFKVPVDQVSTVMDTQFQIVRKGVLTYDELASTIGRSIPSAVRAGQTFQDLGGMIAFLTRNGLSAAMASTSAARAMDLFSNPKFASHMQDIGLAVTDSTGKFRPLIDVMEELRKHFQGMSDSEISTQLAALTKGAGGTIQAMRFLNLVVHDSNDLFGEMTSQVRNSSGAMSNAYGIMFKEPASQLQLLKNNWEILRTEIGDLFIPVVARLVIVGSDVLRWVQNLNPHLRDMIIYGAAFGSAFLLVAGILTAVAGGVLILIGTLAPLVGGIGAAVAIVGGLLAVLLLLPLAMFGVIKNFNDIKRVSTEAWSSVRSDVERVRTFFLEVWDKVSVVVSSAMQAAERDVHWFVDAVEHLFDSVSRDIATMKDWFDKQVKDIGKLWEWLGANTARWWDEISIIINAVVITVIWVVTAAVDIIRWLWDDGMNHVIGIVEQSWNIIFGVIKGVIEIIVGVISFFLDFVTGRWSKLGDDLGHIWKGIWNIMTSIVSGAIGIIVDALSGLADILYNIGKDIVMGIWHGIYGMAKWFTDKIVGFFNDVIPGPLKSFFGLHSPSRLMAGYGRNIVEGLAQGIIGGAGLVQSAMNSAMPNLPGLGGMGMGSKVVYVAPGAIDLSNANISQDSLPGLQNLLNQAVAQLVQEVNAR